MLAWGAFRFADRMKNWERGRPAPTRRTSLTNAKRRFGDFRVGVYMRTLLRDPAAGLMHSMIYFGFLVLLAVTTVLEIDHQMPEDLKFLQGRTYQAYAFVGDAAGVVFVVGVVWAVVRRYVQRPYRIRIKTKPEHALILGTFLLIGLSGFATEMFRIAESSASGENMDYEKWSFIGWPLSQLVDGSSVSTLHGWHNGMWMLHVAAFIAFLAILPITMLRHMFTSPLNMYLQGQEPPEGRDEADAEPGRDRARDVRRLGRRGLHVEAAARHRRLHDVRPLHERVPGPRHRQAARPARDRAQDRRGDGRHRQPGRVAADRHRPRDHDHRQLAVRADHLGGDLGLHDVQGVRRDLPGQHRDPRQDPRHAALPVADGVDFPTELGNAYRGMENQYNPWGMNPSERGDWAKGLDEVQIVDPGEQLQAEYLYWVGCAGSFDDKNKRVTQAMAKLLRRAGITVAVLGPVEMCTGDSARRSGNEYLFRCWRCRTSRCSTAWACRRSSRSARTASTRCSTSTPSSAGTTRSSTTRSCSSS
jgi:nitrate reductase gamma subunit